MRVLTGGTWASGVAPAAAQHRRPRLKDAIAALFAIAALAIAVAPAIEQATDANGADRSGETTPRRTADAPAGPELMFAGYGGVPYTYPSDVTVTKPGLHDFTVRDVAWDGRPFVNPIYYGARIVRFGASRLGTMLDFTHSKAIARLAEDKAFAGTLAGAPAPARATLRDVFRKLEASHGHNMLTLNGLLRLPSLAPRIRPYVGLGAGVSLPHAEVHMANAEARTYEYQVAGPVGQALVGLEFRTARVSYFLEYKLTLAPYTMVLSEREGSLLVFDLWNQLKAWLAGDPPPGGHLTTRFLSHQVIFGLGIRSAPAAPL